MDRCDICRWRDTESCLYECNSEEQYNFELDLHVINEYSILRDKVFDALDKILEDI